MSDKDRDLMALHGMAMQNVAQLDSEESQRVGERYRSHKRHCIDSYGIRDTISAELYGWIPSMEPA